MEPDPSSRAYLAAAQLHRNNPSGPPGRSRRRAEAIRSGKGTGGKRNTQLASKEKELLQPTRACRRFFRLSACLPALFILPVKGEGRGGGGLPAQPL